MSQEELDNSIIEGRWNHPQLMNMAEIVQHVRPDVLLLNEIDFDVERSENALLVERYLKVA